MRVIVEATRPVAVFSPDHIEPWGTRRDNSKNMRFNQKLYQLYPKPEKGILRVLDLGCSGGGFVKTCLDDGCLAVGLEGSDFSKKHRRAEWAIIPEFLSTCDVTSEFEVLLEDDGGHREHLCFDVVTAWEMIEHIAESDLGIVARNVKKHLSSGGLWIMSVSLDEEVIDGVRLHQTVKPKEWWIETFRQLGFEHLEPYVDYFNTQFVRGSKYGAPNSFHLVLSLDKSHAPPIPNQSLITRLYDRWLGSRPQIMVRRLLVGS